MSNLAELESLLHRLTLPDTAVIKDATEVLNKQYLKNPATVPALVEIMCKSQASEIRQMAAVLLRKKIVKLWSRLDQNTQAQIKKILLEALLSEQVAIVRHAIASFVGTIAKIEVPVNRWKELLDFLYSCCSSPNSGTREVGMYLMNNLIETIAEQLRPHYPQLFTLFQQAMRDPENVEVRLLACHCLGSLAHFLSSEEEINMFRQCIPSMITIIQECLKTGDEENAVTVFEVFDDLIECEVPVIAKAIPALAQLFMEIANNRELEENTRVKAVNFIFWIIQFKKKSLQRNKLIEPIINSLLPLIAEENDEPEDEEEQTVARMATHTLDVMALNFPPEQVMPPTLRIIEIFSKHESPAYRRAGLIALAVIIEGASIYLRSFLPTLVQISLAALNDSNQNTREAACIALEQLSVHIQPEIVQYHNEILPALFHVMNDQSPRLIEKACMALEAFCERLGAGILPYLTPLMEKLVFMLQHGNLKTQETVLCAIGSTAHSAEQAFQPFFSQVAEFLRLAMSTTNPEQYQLRSLATDTLGTVALAVGKDIFRPILPEVMRIAIEGVSLPDSYVHECTWSFFVSMAKLFEKELSPFIPSIVPLLFDSCLSEDGLEMIKNEDEDPIMDDEDTEEEGENNFSVATSFLQEKEIACTALGEIFFYVGEAYLPFFEKGLEVLNTMVEYFHADVREAAIISYSRNIIALHNLFDTFKTWEHAQNQPIHANVQSLIKIVNPLFLAVFEGEDERSVVTELCGQITELLDTVGPAVLDGAIEPLAKHLLSLLNKTAVCQTQENEDEEEAEDGATMDEEEEAEIDAMLIDATADVIGSLSKALKGAFVPYFQTFYPLIAKYYKKSRPVADRSMAIGCLAECAAGLGIEVTPFAEEMLKLFLRAAADEEDEVRNNAAYGLGVLCEAVGPSSAKYYGQILQTLHTLFVGNQLTGTMDNACGAVSRMILTNPASVPLEQVLPVLVNSLPLKSDYAENESVFKALFFLFSSNTGVIFPLLPKLMSIFARVLIPPENQLSEEVRGNLLGLLRSLRSQQAEVFQNALAAASADEQVVLMAASA